jgi:predicted phosphodiesterase
VRLALLSDVHGNLIALDAVIADATAVGVTEWWVLGDLAALGAQPTATLERLTSLPNVRFVRGNTDRYLVTGERPSPHADDVARDASLRPLFDAIESSFSWTTETLRSSGWLRFLAELPTDQRRVLSDGTTLLGVHASPGSDDGPGITPHATDEELRALVDDATADVVCGGHTHQATDRVIAARRVVNLGSVSNPVTSDLRATYVVIDDDPRGHSLRHRWVEYDHDAVIEQLRRSTHPEADYLASFQRGEQIRYPATRPGAPSPSVR